MKIGTFALTLLLSVTASAYSYVGVGVTIEQRENDQKQKFYQIVDVLPQGPADRAGVRIEDVVLSVDGQLISTKKLKDVVEMIKGEAGQAVRLGLRRDGGSELEISIVREIIDVQCLMEGSVNLRYSGDNNYGFMSGTIGNDFVNWTVSRLSVYTSFKGSPVRLDIRRTDDNGPMSVTGWYRNHYLSWSGFSDSVHGFQPCIP